MFHNFYISYQIAVIFLEAEAKRNIGKSALL